MESGVLTPVVLVEQIQEGRELVELAAVTAAVVEAAQLATPLQLPPLPQLPRL